MTADGKHSPKTEVDSLINNPVDSEDRFIDLGFELMKDESIGDIKLGIRSKLIIEMLGEPEEKSESVLWGADGEYHQQWKYTKNGIELDIIGEVDTALVVNMITIKSPCELKTKRKIGVGSSIEEIQLAYQKEINHSSSAPETIVAGTIYGGIIFNIECRKVTSFFIGASAD